MGAKYFTLLTRLGEARLSEAISVGKPLEIAQMGVGDGGGTLQTPDSMQTKLVNERRRAPINSLSIDPNNANQIIAEQVIPENEGGFWIREMGLYDAAGNLIAVANCPETYKPELKEGSGRVQTVRMILIVSRTDALTLNFDPTVALATRRYADTLLADHVAKSNPHAQYLLISEFVGIPQPWPQAVAPAGWLKCNGQAFDKNRYPRLAQVYPSGILPDLRGEFIRGWDDGRGVDSGRALMSTQKGSLAVVDDIATLATVDCMRGTINSTGLDAMIGDYSGSTLSYSITGITSQSSFSSAGVVRPRNIAFNYIVRAA